MTKLLEKDVKFKWSQECEESFLTLKKTHSVERASPPVVPPPSATLASAPSPTASPLRYKADARLHSRFFWVDVEASAAGTSPCTMSR
jgi:hypothetical protein